MRRALREFCVYGYCCYRLIRLRGKESVGVEERPRLDVEVARGEQTEIVSFEWVLFDERSECDELILSAQVWDRDVCGWDVRVRGSDGKWKFIVFDEPWLRGEDVVELSSASARTYASSILLMQLRCNLKYRDYLNST